jgi:hypothetical protein
MSLFDYFRNFEFNIWKKEKNIIIDPISCLIKLSVLSLYPEGTKICLYNNSIGFCNPNILQGSIRFVNGDGREDLHNLFKPIKKSIEWFANKSKYKHIPILHKMSIVGLTKLKKCYQDNSTIQHSLDYYISYIRENTEKNSNDQHREDIEQTTQTTQTGDNIQQPYKVTDAYNAFSNLDNNIDNNLDNKPPISLENLSETSHDSGTDNIIHNYLKGLWSKREISIVIELLEEYQIKENQEEKDNIIQSVINLTTTKEKLLNMFLKEQSSVL